jgi:hypothetical protein
MKKHNGMRPQDIVVLSGIITMNREDWRNVDLANSLQISPSEISEALNRCQIARLIDLNKRNVHLNAFREFAIYGLKYVFPAEPGPVVRGIPTAHSAPPVSNYIISGTEIYVWPYHEGNQRGQSIDPLFKTVPVFAMRNKTFYELMAVLDTFRLGRAREVNYAMIYLDELLKNVRN